LALKLIPYSNTSFKSTTAQQETSTGTRFNHVKNCRNPTTPLTPIEIGQDKDTINSKKQIMQVEEYNQYYKDINIREKMAKAKGRSKSITSKL